MRGLETLHEVAVGVAVEGDAERDELADAGRPLVDEHAHGLGVAEARAGDERVADVVLGAVVGEHHAGDAALRVAGVGVLEHVLRHEGDAASALHGVQRDGEPGDAAADDDGVDGRLVVASTLGDRGGRHEAFSQSATGAAGGLAASIRSRARRAGSATSAGTVMRLSTSPATSPSSTHAR